MKKPNLRKPVGSASYSAWNDHIYYNIFGYGILNETILKGKKV